jgi:hypothetical protein
MYRPLNGPAIFAALSVGSTAVEVKVGAAPLEERTSISVQPLDGNIYYGYDSSVSTSNGTKIFKSQLLIIEAASSLPVYVIAETGTVDVRITEVG